MVTDAANEFEIEITGIAHGGYGVGRMSDGRVVFVTDSIPGERVVAKVSDDRNKSFWFADATEILQASEHRRQHFWAEAATENAPENRAGGANFGHIQLQHQRVLKAQVLSDALRRFGKLNDSGLQSLGDSLSVRPVDLDSSHQDATPAAAAISGHQTAKDATPAAAAILGDGTDRAASPHPGNQTAETDETAETGETGNTVRRGTTSETSEAEPGLSWRTRYTLRVDPITETLGVFARRSHRVVPVSNIPLAVAELQQKAPLAENFAGASRVDLIYSSTGEYRITIDELPSKQPITEQVAGRQFQLAEDGFWQVHRSAATVLTKTVLDLVDDALFDPQAANFDLYGGVGLFAGALLDKFGTGTSVTLVESSATAVKYAKRNLSFGSKVQTIAQDTGKFLWQTLQNLSQAEAARVRSGLVVLDPPRSGAGKRVISNLTQLSPEQIVYVACDPVAFARDLSYLAAGGYQLSALRVLDLFPQTHHFETVGLFTKF